MFVSKINTEDFIIYGVIFCKPVYRTHPHLSVEHLNTTENVKHQVWALRDTETKSEQKQIQDQSHFDIKKLEETIFRVISVTDLILNRL